MKKIVILLILVLIITGCGKSNKNVISNKKISATSTTNEVNEEIIKKDKALEYNYETDEIIVNVKISYSDKFTLDEGKLKTNNYEVYLDFTEYKYSMFEQYKNMPGYDEYSVDGKEAIKSRTDRDEIIMVKVSETDILYIIGHTDGKIMTSEMANDSNYKDILKNIKISINKK